VLIPGPIPRAKLARAVSFPRSLPSEPRCLTDPTRQALSFTGRNRNAPDLIPRSLPFQTRPLLLLLAALTAGEIPTTPRVKVFRPSLCELSVASLCLSPLLRAAGCHQGVASPCCVGRSLSSPLHHHDAGAKHPATTPHAVPLLPAALLASRAAPSTIQLPSPAPRRHRALARPCAPRGHHQPPVQLTSSPPAYGQKCLRRRLHASSCRLLPRCALRPRMHAHTVRAWPCAACHARAVLSPLTPCQVGALRSMDASRGHLPVRRR
jgi:hypothetical protein